jgi:hypothetical protein
LYFHSDPFRLTLSGKIRIISRQTDRLQERPNFVAGILRVFDYPELVGFNGLQLLFPLSAAFAINPDSASDSDDI